MQNTEGEHHPESRRQRQDDVWLGHMAKRLYPEVLKQLCDDLGVNKADLYKFVSDGLERQKNRKKHSAAIRISAITAVITAIIASVTAVATDFFNRGG